MKCNKQYLENVALKINVKRLLNLRDPSQPLSDSDRIKVKKVVKGLRVELTHRKEGKCNKISGIATQPVEQLIFLVDEGGKRMYAWLGTSMISIMSSCGMVIGQLFKQEVWEIVEGQRYSKKLNEKQVTAMLRASCQRPKQMEDNIQTLKYHDLGQDVKADLVWWVVEYD
ncbi:hypothetical protein IFM89_007352 [Coptis chinensis]|uniref:Uncharacterized protein n=1 Tax=Coptis chinensis TaxID=261450 RepID=A0A835H4V5_9MAGN|nr:hypothetical protein IFM89_007352 [Coptis chinensis]